MQTSTAITGLALDIPSVYFEFPRRKSTRGAPVSWTSAYVETDRIKLHYHRTGGDKPALVLAHGLTDNGLCWTRLARALEAEYDLVMVDARGHGLSAKPRTDYTVEDHAADLADVVRALDLQQPALIGHSMGAATVAAFGAAHPELAGPLLLEDPPWRPPQEQSAPAQRTRRLADWRDSHIARQQQTRDEIIAFGRKRSPRWHEVEFAPWAEAKLQASPDVFGWGGTSGWIELASQIRSRTALITGDPELGAIVTPALAAAAAAANDRIEIAHIPGAGHNIRRDQFATYLRQVRSLLAH
jgi:N-formylmaleamate deformylase